MEPERRRSGGLDRDDEATILKPMASLTSLIKIFTPEQMALLSSYGQSISYAKDEAIMRQGEDNEHLYLVLRGKVEVRVATDSGPKRIATVVSGHSLGEISIFDPGVASATVIAVEESDLWRITAGQLETFHEEHPRAAYKLVTRIAYCLADRLRGSNERHS